MPAGHEAFQKMSRGFYDLVFACTSFQAPSAPEQVMQSWKQSRARLRWCAAWRLFAGMASGDCVDAPRAGRWMVGVTMSCCATTNTLSGVLHHAIPCMCKVQYTLFSCKMFLLLEQPLARPPQASTLSDKQQTTSKLDTVKRLYGGCTTYACPRPLEPPHLYGFSIKFKVNKL